MNPLNQCQQCGGVLPQAYAVGGRCPRCMLALGFETESESLVDSKGSPAERAPTDGVAARPSAIGRYRILRVVGEGGMGVVYEAEQDQPRRTVALKIIKPALASPEMLRRFELESQALGRLQHPGIAQIYDAGTVDTGFGPQPYFAMELIHGLSPRDYAEANHLNTRDRLAMMVKVCDAVHHAHQRGLIHRDLKPANILVDTTGQPKILDFGVARVTDGDARATLTDMGQLVGTLAYMSPEQALADPLDIDTRSDVYALGVILYELLSGRLPYTISRKLHETIQAIREADPDPLSTVNRAYRGDIETIVRKALEKDRTRRYAAAAGMAADIQRYLNDEPIAARPPSASYQLRKFAHRNKALVAGVAGVFIALVVGVVAFAWMANLYVNERNRAEEEKAKAEKGEANAKVLADFFGASLFGLADPVAQGTLNESSSTNPNITLKAGLDLAVRRIPFQFAQRPLMDALVREYVADTYTGMGRYIEALDQLEIAVGLRRREQGDKTPETVQATVKLADAYSNSKMYSKAVESAKKVILDARNIGGGVDINLYVKKAVSILVFISSGSLANPDQARDFPEIERFLRREVVDYQRAKSGAADATVQFSVDEMLSLYTDYRPPKYSEAVAFIEHIADDRRRVLGGDHPATLKAEKQLIALFLISQPHPRHAEAEAYLIRRVDGLRKTLGDDHSATQSAVNHLLSVYLNQPRPRYAESETLLKNIIEKAKTRLAAGNQSSAMLSASIGLATVYFRTNRDTEAVNLLTPLTSTEAVNEAIAHPNIVDIQPPFLDTLDQSQIYGRRATGALTISMARLTLTESPTVLDALDLLGQIYSKQGNAAMADLMAKHLTAILEAALNSARNKDPLGNESAAALKSMAAFAIRFIAQGRNVDAAELLSDVVRGYRQFTESGLYPGQNTPPIISATRTTNNSGNDSSVSGYQQLARSSRQTKDIATQLTSAAMAYSSKGMDLDAERTLKKVLDINRFVLGDSSWDTQRSVWRLASWYMGRSKYQEAHKTFDFLHEIQIQTYGLTHVITRTTMVDMMGAYGDRVPIESLAGRKGHRRFLVVWDLELRTKLLAIYGLEPDGKTSANARLMISGMGSLLGMLGRNPEAEERFTKLVAILDSAVDPTLESIPTANANLGWTQFQQRKFSEAETSLRKALRGYEAIKSQTWERYNTESMLGAVLVALGEFAEAERHLTNSYDKLLLRPPGRRPASGFTAESEPGERIVSLYQRWGKPAKVAEWRKRILESKTTPASGL